MYFQSFRLLRFFLLLLQQNVSDTKTSGSQLGWHQYICTSQDESRKCFDNLDTVLQNKKDGFNDKEDQISTSNIFETFLGITKN